MAAPGTTDDTPTKHILPAWFYTKTGKTVSISVGVVLLLLILFMILRR